MKVVVSGRGGGKSQSQSTSYAPTEADDSLRSKAYARIIDLIGEGELEGFVDSAGNPLENATFGTPVVSGGVITSVPVLLGGKGYTTSVPITFTDDDGTAAAATAVVDADGAITSLVIDNGGSGYTAPTVSVPAIVSRGVYLDDTPLMNDSYEFNFPDVSVEFKTGTQDQTPISLFSTAESAHNLNIPLTKEQEVRFSVQNDVADKVLIGLSVPSLYYQNPANGSISETAVSINVYVRYANEKRSYSEELEHVVQFTGKTRSRYQKVIELTLSRDADARNHDWTFRIERITADATSVAYSNLTYVDFYSTKTNSQFSYPNSALIGIEVNAEAFSNIPKRAYDLRLLRVQVPANYFPTTRAYNRDKDTGDAIVDGSGIPVTQTWDGTFYTAWTDNPAWVCYDLLTSRRYGLGEHLNGYYGSADKWFFYSIAQYCDELVSDGYGSQEPRFTANLYIQARNDALRVVNDLMSIFRGMAYWLGGQVIPVVDRQKSTIMQFSPANVEGGLFTYAGTSRRARHTAALVRWIDPTNGFRPRVEYRDDPDGILRYGVNEKEIEAFGCTSRGQAARLGDYLLLSEKLLVDTVTQRTGEEGFALRPGDIFEVMDPSRNGVQYAGRVLSIGEDYTSVTLDRAPNISGDFTATFAIPAAHFEPGDVDDSDDVDSLRVPQIIERDVAGYGLTTDGKNLVLNFSSEFSETQSITSLAYDPASGRATATRTDHNRLVGDRVEISGADDSEYNGFYSIVSVTKDTFQYEPFGFPPSPTTGTIVAKYPTVVPGAVWGLANSVVTPRKYRTLSVRHDNQKGIFEVTGLQYLDEIFDRVDHEVLFDEQQYSPIPALLTTPGPVRNLTFYRTIDGGNYNINIDWEAPLSTIVKHYEVYVKVGLANWVLAATVGDTSVDLTYTAAQTYGFRVYAVGISGRRATPITDYTFLGYTDTGVVDLVSGLELAGQGSDTEFVEVDVVFDWRINSHTAPKIGNEFYSDPFNEAVDGAEMPAEPSYETVRYDVRVLNADGDKVYPAVSAYYDNGTTTEFTVTKAMNDAFDGGPLRDFMLEVTLVQTVNAVTVRSLPKALRVTNSHPSQPDGVLIASASGQITVTLPSEYLDLADYGGFVFWVSDSAGFSTSLTPFELLSGNSKVVSTYRDSIDVEQALVAGYGYYVRFALRDTFAGSNYTECGVSRVRSITVN